MNYLLDTCVLSEFGKPRPDAGVSDWIKKQNPQGFFVSEMTVAELAAGEIKLRAKDAARADRLATWIDVMTMRFAGNTLGVDTAVWAIWSQLSGAADAQGKSIAPLDALLMATAQRHGLTVVTRNVADFGAYPLVLNPWSVAA